MAVSEFEKERELRDLRDRLRSVDVRYIETVRRMKEEALQLLEQNGEGGMVPIRVARRIIQETFVM